MSLERANSWRNERALVLGAKAPAEAPLPFLRVNLFFESNLLMLSSDFVLRRHLQVDSKKGKAGAR